MLDRFTDEQLLAHLAGLGEWAAIRAGELQYVTERLSEEFAKADPPRKASLRYALSVYVEGVEELARRCREAQAELERRGAAAGTPQD
jgi:hypothetical protein